MAEKLDAACEFFGLDAGAEAGFVGAVAGDEDA